LIDSFIKDPYLILLGISFFSIYAEKEGAL
jgi:hypothetical protein